MAEAGGGSRSSFKEGLAGGVRKWEKKKNGLLKALLRSSHVRGKDTTRIGVRNKAGSSLGERIGTCGRG